MESGTVVLGVDRPEEALDHNGVGPRDDMGQLQMQVDGPVVLNQSAELGSEDSMNVDDVPIQAPSGDPVAATQQSPATLADTIMEVQKQLKRKRASNSPVIAAADKDALVARCWQELEGLFQFYKEVSDRKMQLDGRNLSINGMVGCLLEESSLGLTKLVDEIYGKLKGLEGVSLASVRSSLLLAGQRIMYGKSSPDADVLEDESESALWCWEIRDLRLLPVKARSIVSTRRSVRKKIHERITAIYSTLSVLENPGTYVQVNDLKKASLKLNKSLNLEGIRSMVERATQKNTERGVKDAGSAVKELMQETEKNDQNIRRPEDTSVSELQNGNLPANEKEIQKAQKQVEKEIKRQEKEEAQMRKLQKKQQEEALREQKRREKEEAEVKKQQKKQEEEALKEQKRREREEAEVKKQQKKQQEETEKEQKRLEKEAAQLKKQLAIQKQASMMERFFKNKKDSGKLQKPRENNSVDDPCNDNKETIPATTLKIDSSLSQQESWVLEDLWRLQVIGWKKLSSYNRSSRWGIRCKPKMEAFKELKLQKSSDDMVDEILSASNEDGAHNSSQENEHDKLESDIDMLQASEVQCHGNSNPKPLQTRLIRKKLLQFDKSNRPAYYGSWRKKSAVIGPRCPLKMDPDLDYEVDSDDEWEEEDPGESLSDCEKDNDEFMEEDSKITDEEDEDSFVVPDGYLSDNEGIQIESLLDDKDEEASSSPTGQCTEVEEFRSLLRQQRVLNTLTEQALRKSQPLIISNLNHEKAKLLTAEDLKGMAKIEQLCLQVLSMRICPGGAAVDVPLIDSSSATVEETDQTNEKNGSPGAASAIPETDLLEIVQVIRSCRDGIHKVVELLQHKFPNVPKTQLNRKVREISEFIDNHWKVKKEILDKLGLNSSPVKSKKNKSIANYFSKRCLPPEEAVNALAASPELRLKSKTKGNFYKCSFEDPEKILEQAVLEMNNDLTKMRQATAQVLASQKRLENKYKAAEQASADWYQRAQLALQKGDEDLAREALKRCKSYADNASSLRSHLDQQKGVVENLISNTKVLESKIAEAKQKKDTLKARAQSAKTATKVSEMLGNVNTSSALSAFEKMEEKVMAMESQAEALGQLATDDLEGKFALLETSSVDDDLSQLKKELSGSSLKGELPPGRAAVSNSGAGRAFPDLEIESELNELRRKAKEY